MSKSVNVFHAVDMSDERAGERVPVVFCAGVRDVCRLSITATHAGVLPLLALELHIINEHIQTWLHSHDSPVFITWHLFNEIQLERKCVSFMFILFQVMKMLSIVSDYSPENK